jgi:hypothetical protein
MLKTCTSGAAFSASAYRYGTSSIYSDWFLPSKDELNQMYVNKTNIGGFTTGYYWSSSEVVANNARYQLFPNGAQNVAVKSNGYYVRPVRAF